MSPSVEPFDEAKYKALMDGLNATEVYYKSLGGIIDYRIEAEYFDKRFLLNEMIIAKNKTVAFSDIAYAENGRAYSSEFFSSDGDIFVAKIGDVTNKRAISDYEMLDSCEYNKQNGAMLINDDILMTLTGDPPDVGKTNIVTITDEHCTWNQRVAKIGLKEHGYISNYVLFAVLSCETIRMQMERYAKGIRQRNLGNDCFNYVRLPLLNNLFQQSLHKIIQGFINLRQQANILYQKAEKTILSIINIEIDMLGTPAAIKNLNESFAVSGRLDAEYYQPKYEEYAKALKTTETVSSLCNIFDRNYLPEDMESYQYIELANVGASGEISGVETQVGKELPTRARRKVKSGQVIVSSIEGSLKSCALITNEYDGALCSTGFYVVDSDYINSETLLVLFQSEPIQALLKQRCSGTILTGISKDEFLSMPLPKVDEDIQKEIAAKIQESFALRKQSKQLLEYAKHAVEMAIEEGEDRALEWLKSKGVEG